MADFQTFDLGHVLQTAEAIKGLRNQAADDNLRRQYLGVQISGAQQQQTEQAKQSAIADQVTAAKRQYYTAQAALSSADPKGTIEAIAPQFVQDFESKHGQGSWQQVTPDQAHAAAQQIAQQAQTVIGPQQKVKWLDNGGVQTPVDEITGQPIEGLKPQAKTATPDAQLSAQTSTANNAATNATSRANNAATVGATIRGQDKSATDKGIPSGYEPDPTKPGAVRPIAGGPHDPNAVSGGMDSRSSVMFNRVAASAQAASKAISNIMELPVTTSSGFFGTAEPGHGLLDSARNVLAQKITGQEAQDFKTMVAGVSRNLSTIETAGLAPNGAITNSMNSVLLGEGDTQMTKLRKMAEMRQIVEENLKPQLANPKLAPAQKDLVRTIIGNVQQSVPFTQHDITLLQQSKNPNATISDFATQKGLPAAGGEVTATGPGGQQIVLRNGQWVPK